MNLSWEIHARAGRLRVFVRDGNGAMISQSDDALTSVQVARRLAKSRRHVYRYVERGLLTPLGKFLNEWLFDAGQVERFRQALGFGRIPLRRPAVPGEFQAFFPEYTLDQMNPWTNAVMIVTRILDSGTRRQWLWVFRHYPRSLVRAVVRDHGARLMSDRSRHFWAWLLGVAGRPRRVGRPVRGGL